MNQNELTGNVQLSVNKKTTCSCQDPGCITSPGSHWRRFNTFNVSDGSLQVSVSSSVGVRLLHDGQLIAAAAAELFVSTNVGLMFVWRHNHQTTYI